MENKVSDKQVLANRLNATKWGVKTEKGKELISRNAVKHGLTGDMIIDEEERYCYEAIFDLLKEELKPESLLEGMMVERIALAYVKLQRVVKLYNNQLIIDGLRREMKYIEDMKPERKLVFDNFEMFDKSDQEKEEKILEIEGKMTTIKKKLEAIDSANGWLLDIDTYEKFQRYETSIENRLYKSIREYTKIKAMKNGAPVIDINVEA